MPTSSRLRGNVAPIFTGALVDATDKASAAVDLAADLKKAGFTSKDKDSKDLTFWEAAQGSSVDRTFTMTMVTSFDAAALYRWLSDNSGALVEFVWGPWGNLTPTPTKPHYRFRANLPARPDIDTQAAIDGAGADYEAKLALTGDYTLVTGETNPSGGGA